MNYLAHLYLSGDSEGLLIGNFIADAVKGSQWEKYPREIQEGILLHRQIDSFTDQHPLVSQGKSRLWEHLGKYAGIATDVFYDHFLAVNWADYHKQPLEGFTQEKYKLLENYLGEMPLRSRQFYGYMVSRNILVGYRSMAILENVFHGMSNRALPASGLETSVEWLQRDYNLLEEEFRNFFPDLEKRVAEVVAEF